MAPDAAQRQSETQAGRFSHAWRALKHRNFKLFVAGKSISLIGTWMTRLATSWLVWRLTHSAMLLGVVGPFPWRAAHGDDHRWMLSAGLAAVYV
jgi:hypothetical protein